MRFNVYAGQMFCGELTITSNGVHIYRGRAGVLSPTKMGAYKNLRLKRTV